MISNYCSFCGTKLKNTDEICPSCGKTISEEQYAGIERIGAGGTGFAETIDHESFAAYRKKLKKTVRIILPIIALVIAIGLMFMGVGPAGSIFAGICMLVLMFAVAAVQGRKKPDWEGTVTKKSYSHIRKKGADSHIYKIHFRTDSGENKTQTWRSHTSVYDYLQEGDRVRFLGSIGTPYAFEKYDKSTDESIPCVCCGHLMDPRYTFCTLCGGFLLKR